MAEHNFDFEFYERPENALKQYGLRPEDYSGEVEGAVLAKKRRIAFFNSKATQAFLKALGVEDLTRVREVEISIRAGELVEVTLRKVVTEDQLEALTVELKGCKSDA